MVGVKKKLIFIFLSLLMLSLLTGCHSDVECVTYGLPEGAKISYLVKDTETTALSAEPDKNKNEPDNNSLKFRRNTPLLSRTGIIIGASLRITIKKTVLKAYEPQE